MHQSNLPVFEIQEREIHHKDTEGTKIFWVTQGQPPVVRPVWIAFSNFRTVLVSTPTEASRKGTRRYAKGMDLKFVGGAAKSVSSDVCR